MATTCRAWEDEDEGPPSPKHPCMILMSPMMWDNVPCGNQLNLAVNTFHVQLDDPATGAGAWAELDGLHTTTLVRGETGFLPGVLSLAGYLTGMLPGPHYVTAFVNSSKGDIIVRSNSVAFACTGEKEYSVEGLESVPAEAGMTTGAARFWGLKLLTPRVMARGAAYVSFEVIAVQRSVVSVTFFLDSHKLAHFAICANMLERSACTVSASFTLRKIFTLPLPPSIHGTHQITVLLTGIDGVYNEPAPFAHVSSTFFSAAAPVHLDSEFVQEDDLSLGLSSMTVAIVRPTQGTTVCAIAGIDVHVAVTHSGLHVPSQPLPLDIVLDGVVVQSKTGGESFATKLNNVSPGNHTLRIIARDDEAYVARNDGSWSSDQVVFSVDNTACITDNAGASNGAGLEMVLVAVGMDAMCGIVGSEEQHTLASIVDSLQSVAEVAVTHSDACVAGQVHGLPRNQTEWDRRQVMRHAAGETNRRFVLLNGCQNGGIATWSRGVRRFVEDETDLVAVVHGSQLTSDLGCYSDLSSSDAVVVIGSVSADISEMLLRLTEHTVSVHHASSSGSVGKATLEALRSAHRRLPSRDLRIVTPRSIEMDNLWHESGLTPENPPKDKTSVGLLVALPDFARPLIFPADDGEFSRSVAGLFYVIKSPNVMQAAPNTSLAVYSNSQYSQVVGPMRQYLDGQLDLFQISAHLPNKLHPAVHGFEVVLDLGLDQIPKENRLSAATYYYVSTREHEGIVNAPPVLRSTNDPIVASCFIVNLNRRPAKWIAAQAATSSLPFPCERFAASDGNAPSVRAELLQQYPDAIETFDWTFGQMGCALSHHKLLTRIAAMKTNSPVLVLEDDAVLAPNVADPVGFLTRVFDAWPHDADIVYTGHCDAIILATHSDTDTDTNTDTNTDAGGRLLVRGSAHCTHSYATTPHGARHLLATLDAAVQAVDEIWRRGCNSGILVCYLTLTQPITDDVDRMSGSLFVQRGDEPSDTSTYAVQETEEEQQQVATHKDDAPKTGTATTPSMEAAPPPRMAGETVCVIIGKQQRSSVNTPTSQSTASHIVFDRKPCTTVTEISATHPGHAQKLRQRYASAIRAGTGLDRIAALASQQRALAKGLQLIPTRDANVNDDAVKIERDDDLLVVLNEAREVDNGGVLGIAAAASRVLSVGLNGNDVWFLGSELHYVCTAQAAHRLQELFAKDGHGWAWEQVCRDGALRCHYQQ